MHPDDQVQVAVVVDQWQLEAVQQVVLPATADLSGPWILPNYWSILVSRSQSPLVRPLSVVASAIQVETLREALLVVVPATCRCQEADQHRAVVELLHHGHYQQTNPQAFYNRGSLAVADHGPIPAAE